MQEEYPPPNKQAKNTKERMRLRMRNPNIVDACFSMPERKEHAAVSSIDK